MKHLILTGLVLLSLKMTAQTNKSVPVKIDWMQNITGDFSFRDSWSYPEGVYVNMWGQLSCDGFCPEEIDEMKDSLGRIADKDLKAFYKILDTTHEFYNLTCDAWCYEFGEIHFIKVYYKGKNKYRAHTMCNVGTHSALDLDMNNDTCLAYISTNSVTPSGHSTYYCTGGWIRIDQTLLKKGIMKAEFSFDFAHPQQPSSPFYWRGKMYAKVGKQ